MRQLQNLVESTASLNLNESVFKHPVIPVPASRKEEVPAQAPPKPVFTDEASIQILSEMLGVARGTVAKLVAEASLPRPPSKPDEAYRALLKEALTQHLQVLLEAHNYHQARLCAQHGLSKTTLHKVMDLLGFPRPKGLSKAQIKEALAEVSGDMEACARLLRVSLRGLQLRVTELDKA